MNILAETTVFVLLLFTASVALGAPAARGNATENSLEELKGKIEAELEELSCLLNANITKRAEFYNTVKSNHGFHNSGM